MKSCDIVKSCVISILDHIDKGVTTQQIKENVESYIISGKFREIIISKRGFGLKVPEKMIYEMAELGDIHAKRIIEKDDFKEYSNNHSRFAFLVNELGEYDRFNENLIKLIKSNLVDEFEICQVPVEEWTYKIRVRDDYWLSEYIDFYVSKLSPQDTEIK